MRSAYAIKSKPPAWLRFFTEERGEVAPVTYLVTLPLAFMFIFFALDVGLRKGARLAVEYAAFCAARAAAVYMPAADGTCLDATEQATHAAAACLASVASKAAVQGGPGQPQPGVISQLVQTARTQHKVAVRLSSTCERNAVITAEVSYLYGPELPYSPLLQSGGLTMVASAQAMLQSAK